MKTYEPTIFKTKAWKRLEKELGKPPKFKVTPTDWNNPEEIKKAKQMQKLINYMYKTNQNGITDKYWQFMKLMGKYAFKEQVYGIKTRWEVIEKAVKKIIKEEL